MRDICDNYHGGNSYSEQAFNLTSDEFRKKLQDEIYKFLLARGVRGSTCDEAEVLLNLPHQTCSARFSQLKKDKVIIDTGTSRKTRRNRPAAVFVANLELLTAFKEMQEKEKQQKEESEWA